MFNNLRQDYRRSGDSFRERLREMLFNPGMWAVVSYRFRRWVFTLHVPRPVRWPLIPIALLVQLLTEITTSIQLSAAAKIGQGLYLPHMGTIVVGSGSTIGSNCTLCHGVTIGHRGGGRGGSRTGNPVISDRVYIGPGSAIVGPIVIGEDAVVGVSAVVIRSVPSRGVVAGNPARILSYAGSFDLIRYPGMERDQHRELSLCSRYSASEESSESHQIGTMLNGTVS